MEASRKHKDLFIINIFITFFILGSTQKNVRGEANLQRVANNSIVKTIQHESGDVFDCYLINEQPSLRNPLLRDHKIQMKPTVVASFDYDQKMNASFSHANPSTIECPVGTVPIRRSDDERLSLGSFDDLLPSNFSTRADPHEDDYVAFIAAWSTRSSKYYGARTSLGVWEVEGVGSTQKSGAMLWILDDTQHGDFDIISVGWAVAPQLYNDQKPRLTISWKAVGSPSCFNTRCGEGFVQVHPKIALGSTFPIVSEYKEYQYYVTLALSKDPDTKAWWLYIGEDLEPLGYWPAHYFKYLADYTPLVQTGGVTSSLKTDAAPAMGNGHSPNEGIGIAGSVMQVFTANEGRKFVNPIGLFTGFVESKTSCYRVGSPRDDNVKGMSFAYGGGAGCRI